MEAAMDAGYGNPSGAHALARAGRSALDGARAELAERVGAAPGDVVFTSGGTEADNFAIRGAAEALEVTGRPVVDSNGAGDAYVSGFLTGWLAGDDARSAALSGAVALRHDTSAMQFGQATDQRQTDAQTALPAAELREQFKHLGQHLG